MAKLTGSGARGSYSHGMGFEVIAFALVTLVGVGSSIAIARLCGVTVLGEYALAFAPYYILNNLSSVREQAGFARRITTIEPRDPEITGLWTAMFGFSTLLTLGMSIAVLVVTWLLFAGPIGQPELFTLAVIPIVFNVLVFNPGWNLDRVLTTFRAGRALLWIRVGQAVLTAAAMIGAGLVWGTAHALVLAEVLSWVPILLWRVLAVRRYMRLIVPWSVIRDGAESLREIVSFGLKVTPGTLAEAALNQLGTWIIGAFAPLAALGAYSRAWQLVRRLLVLRPRIAEMLFPTLIERRERGDTAGADRALVDTMRYVLTGLTMVAAVGGGAAVGIMNIFGPGFDEAAGALVFLLLVPPLAICSFVQFQSMWALNRPGASSMISLVRAAVGLPLMVVLTWQMGIVGCAIGQALAYAAGIVVITVQTSRELSSPLTSLFPVRQMVAIPLAYGAGFIAARVVDQALPAFAGVPSGMVLGAVAFAGVIALVGGWHDRDRDRIVGILARLRRAAPSRGAAPASS